MKQIWPCVRAIFPTWSARWEGRVPWMYLDAEGLVTTGVGNLIDPLGAATFLPWQHPDGSFASPREIAETWKKVHAAQHLRGIGGAKRAFRELTSLRLSPDAIDMLVAHKLDAVAAALVLRFPRFGVWPADAQLGTLSMGYAMGVDRFNEFPKFSAAVNALDFNTASRESHMDEEGNAPLAPRNAANKELFTNAARVLAEGLPLDAFLRDTLRASAALDVTDGGQNLPVFVAPNPLDDDDGSDPKENA